MDCIKCNTTITKLTDVYRQYNDIIICYTCAPSLIRCKCGKILSINSLYNHNKSKIHTEYIVKQILELNLNI